MTETYEKWIDDNISINKMKNRAEYWCMRMQNRFPELKKIKGYIVQNNVKHNHTWLHDLDNNIVDPIKQVIGIGKYIEKKKGI
jgi:hypothetical protein